jgi:predicted nucleic acid-binding protein
VGAAHVILLDTNVLVDLHRYRLDTAERYAASILSRAELEFGVLAARDPHVAADRLRWLHDLDDRFDWLEFDVAAGRSYGIVAAAARATGAKVRGKDALIAAQAHRHGAAVLTANPADFRPFDHLVRVLAPTPREA